MGKELIQKENFMKSMKAGLTYLQLRDKLSKYSDVVAHFNTSDYGDFLSLHKVVEIEGLEFAVLLVNIYAGSSIQNSPDYNNDLEYFVNKHADRIMIKSFVNDNKVQFHRMYLRKNKGV